MRTWKNQFVLQCVITSSVLCGQLPAQTFNVLYSFTNTDASNPLGLIISGNTLFGAALGSDGLRGYGTSARQLGPPYPLRRSSLTARTRSPIPFQVLNSFSG